jgi:hypothetical protein
MKITPSRSETVSPGRPMIRLTKVPPAPQRRCASGGVLKTTTSPRLGSRRWKMTRFASTRSDVPA